MNATIAGAGVPVPLRRVEDELTRQMRELQGAADTPVQRARMSNLVVFCDQRAQTEEVAGQVPEIVAAHPARVLLLLGERDQDADAQGNGGVAAAVLVRRLQAGHNHRSFSEQVLL